MVKNMVALRSIITASALWLATGAASNGTHFVFLQKFPLGDENVTYHTEVLVCPRSEFSEVDQKMLDGKIVGMKDFAWVDEPWWTKSTANCVELGYGGDLCLKECCGVPHGTENQNYPLNARRAVIVNANVNAKQLYIYGTGAFDGNIAWHHACDRKCWSKWSGLDYNPITNNCNTFTSTILAMVYGLSQKKPHLTISDLITVHGHCPSQASEPEMPMTELKPAYVGASSTQSEIAHSPSNGSHFVFLQRFPLGGGNFTYHTEVLVCPRTEFSKSDQQMLDGKVDGLKDFAWVDEPWWTANTANCVELGYGGAFCKDECCGVPHGAHQQQYPLNARRAVIGNANVNEKNVFLYGRGDFDGNTAWHNACDHKCWSNWAGTDYNPITNNCNTFTSTILYMVYGLSQKKPHLTISDLVTVHGHCPSSGAEAEMPVAELKKQADAVVI